MDKTNRENENDCSGLSTCNIYCLVLCCFPRLISVYRLSFIFLFLYSFVLSFYKRMRRANIQILEFNVPQHYCWKMSQFLSLHTCHLFFYLHVQSSKKQSTNIADIIRSSVRRDAIERAFRMWFYFVICVCEYVPNKWEQQIFTIFKLMRRMWISRWKFHGGDGKTKQDLMEFRVKKMFHHFDRHLPDCRTLF